MYRWTLKDVTLTATNAGFLDLADNSRALNLLHRYVTHHERESPPALAPLWRRVPNEPSPISGQCAVPAPCTPDLRSTL